MNRCFVILVVGLTTGLLASTSIGSVPVEAAIERELRCLNHLGKIFKNLKNLFELVIPLKQLTW